jgi:hypothetical protein
MGMVFQISTIYARLTIFVSYDAAEDNEITFREGERIIEIEPASEDWWMGKNEQGEIGLFPGTFTPKPHVLRLNLIVSSRLC